ncbi:unnamed protein product [Rodentolepis nana]|uniref:ASH domain-containing protein n=1 Tax=Rodentolepis nana TaxID=102285 RepID=A0A0R3TNS3_RODNA|nr:unnamed protein product [Rodentolepis nana]
MKNNSNKVVSVRVVPSNPHTIINSQSQKRIHPRTSTDFDVTIKPVSQGDFSGILNIQVDEKPFDSITLKGIVELPHLDLNPREINLKWINGGSGIVSTDGLRDFVRLRNHLNVPMTFKWNTESVNEGFEIYPESGTLMANTNQDCEVSYKFLLKCGKLPTKKALFVLSTCVEGPISIKGIPSQLEVQIRLPQPKLITSSKRIKLGDVPWGLDVQKYISLKNVGNGPAFVKICAIGELNSVQLTFGNTPVEIRSQEEASFEITVNSRNTGYFQVPISIKHADKEVMQMLVQGNCVFPNVDIFPETIHFTLDNCEEKSGGNGIPTGEKAFAKVTAFRYDFYPHLIINGRKIEQRFCRISEIAIPPLVNIYPRKIIFNIYQMSNNATGILTQVKFEICVPFFCGKI